jgi:hypothetical protein
VRGASFLVVPALTKVGDRSCARQGVMRIPLMPVYMALIEPFRRFLVYPAMLGNLRAAWVAAYPED